MVNKLSPAVFQAQNTQIAEKIAYKNSRKGKCAKIAWNIFSGLIFPIGIIRLTNRKLNQFAQKNVLRSVVLYNTRKKNLNALEELRSNFLANTENKAERITLKTADGINLDNVIIRHAKQNELPTNQQKWLVYFMGNAMCYEQSLEFLKEISKETGVNILVGNPRGVFDSEGKSKSSKDLVTDGEAKMDYLISLGVDPKNILAHGFSIGGGIATAVVAKYQEKGHEMNLCNDRSFASLKAVTTHFKGKFIGTLINTLLARRWNFNSVKNYQKVNGYKFVLLAKDDQTIPYKASLHKHLKKTSQKSKATVKFNPGYIKVHTTSLRRCDEVYSPYKSHVKAALHFRG